MKMWDGIATPVENMLGGNDEAQAERQQRLGISARDGRIKSESREALR